MSKVYIVTSGTYSDYGINRVFSIKELAEEFVNGNTECYIEEWDLDVADDKINKQYWIATIDLYDVPKVGRLEERIAGSLCPTYGSRYEEVDKHLRTGTCYMSYFKAEEKHGVIPAYPESGRIGSKSYVSQDHANKIAIEAYQSWLRNGKSKEGFDFTLKSEGNKT